MNHKLKIVLFSNYGAVISLGLFSPIAALYVVQIGGSTMEAAIVAALHHVLAGLLMIIFGKLEDNQHNRPRMYLAGYLLGALASICLIFTNSITQLLLVQAVYAVAAALRIPSQRALYAEHEDEGHEGREWSIMEGGDFLILGIAAATGGFIASTFSFDIVFTAMAILQLLAGLLCISLITPKKAKTND
jgi:MFS family permease